MRVLGPISVVLMLLVGPAIHAWGQTRGIEVAVKADSGSVESVRLYSQAYAVIIGIDRYASLPPGSELSYAVRDAQGVAEVLARDYAFDGIVTIYNEDATREGILRILSAELRQTSEDDSVFIFWAGHALTQRTAGRGDIGYLVPYDGTFDDSEMSFKNISMTTIKEDISRAIPAKHLFLVVDACYSGLLVTRALESSPPERSLEYLRDITGEEVRQVLTAGKADQQVLDGGPRGHSVFTGRFIEALEEATDYITATEISTRISEEVFSDAAARGHAQTPQGGKLFGLGDYVFAPKRTAAASVAPDEAPPQDGALAVELAFWRSVQGSENPKDYEAYLRRYPDGAFADLARNRLEELAGTQTAAVVAPPEPKTPAVAEEAVGVYPETFRDCAECPEMVVIPPGEFVMGSPEGEEGRDSDEGPQHAVRIARPFGLGKYEVTRAEFAAFARETAHEASGCLAYTGGEWKQDASKSWRDPGYEQTDRDPVACVSWDDAKAYLAWLSRQAGTTYRLASESEWEYAARANTTTARFWGEGADRGCGYANAHDRTSKRENGFDWTHHDCDDGYVQTAPAGSFAANAFGVHDMLGNVSEWTEDCWNGSYEGAPADGSAWRSGDCGPRVLRGGSWVNWPRVVRAAGRGRGGFGSRGDFLGFRVARTLTP